MFVSTAALALIGAGLTNAKILWDGRLNGQKSSAFLNNWSFSNEVGPYQYYIHGDGPVTDYVNLSPNYKNPADKGSKQGIQITNDKNSNWNNDGMLRTELIPQTTAPINEGKVFYHFSVQHTNVDPPSPLEEHQVCFFESHFTEMKYGLIDGEQGTKDAHLRWEVNSQSQWNVTFGAGVWHNIAYGIDFDGGSVTFYHSTGAAPLKKTVGPVSVSASSNGADWHLGVLRLPETNGKTDSAAEHWHFSGVYIENGDLTTSVSGPGAPVAEAASSAKKTSMKKTAAKATPKPAVTKKSSGEKEVATTLVTKVKPSAAPVYGSITLTYGDSTTAKHTSTGEKSAESSSASKPKPPVSSKSTPTKSEVSAATGSASASSPLMYGSITLTYSLSSTAETSAAATSDCDVEYAYV